MIHAKLIINVTYDAPESEKDDICYNLKQAANYLANNGLLSGDDSNAIVDTWDYEVLLASPLQPIQLNLFEKA